MLSSLAFTDAWRHPKPQFEARGHKLNLVLEPSGKIAKRVSDGEAGDAILNTTSSIDGLSKDGKVVSKDCNACHVVLSQVEGATTLSSIQGASFQHPVDLGDLTLVNCSDCHAGSQ